MFLNDCLQVVLYLVVPQNILRLCFWRAAAVLQRSRRPPRRRPSAATLCRSMNTTRQHQRRRRRSRRRRRAPLLLLGHLQRQGAHTCPPERSPSAQPPKCQQHEADLQTGWLPPGRPVPVGGGTPPRPAAPAAPAGRRAAGPAATPRCERRLTSTAFSGA